jgi:hypothetical protein
MGGDSGHSGQTNTAAVGDLCIGRGILMVVRPDTKSFRIVTER